MDAFAEGAVRGYLAGCAARGEGFSWDHMWGIGLGHRLLGTKIHAPVHKFAYGPMMKDKFQKAQKELGAWGVHMREGKLKEMERYMEEGKGMAVAALWDAEERYAKAKYEQEEKAKRTAEEDEKERKRQEEKKEKRRVEAEKAEKERAEEEKARGCGATSSSAPPLASDAELKVLKKDADADEDFAALVKPKKGGKK